jgi:hypothetical protein
MSKTALFETRFRSAIRNFEFSKPSKLKMLSTVLVCLAFLSCQKDLKNPQNQLFSINEVEPTQEIDIRTKPTKIEVNQAVLINPEDNSSGSPSALMMNSLCEGQYVLQMKRLINVTGAVNIRVFTKDYNDSGFSAVVNTIDYSSLSTSSFTTVLLFDGLNEICFLSTDNIAFIQPFAFGQDIEFEVRWHNVSGGLNTTPETIDWQSPNKYYYSMYPDDAGDCENLNPNFCCEYKLIANIVGSGSYSGTMRYFSSWDNDIIDLFPPPEDVDFYVSDNCGPIGAMWNTTDHENDGGEGEAVFECDETRYIWEISESSSVHGVIFDPNGRLCRIKY